MMDQDLVSFVIRFVREAGEREQARWRGIINHVQSNSRTSFTEFSEAVAFMQGFVNDIAQANVAYDNHTDEDDSQTNPFLETAQLWGDFMPRYTRMMMDAMGEAVGGQSDWNLGKPVEQAMDTTLSAWGMPSRAEQQRVANSIENIAQQMVQLTAKLADLEQQVAALRAESKKGSE
jgi:hypothetical protein